jgi:hypothetical protein
MSRAVQGRVCSTLLQTRPNPLLQVWPCSEGRRGCSECIGSGSEWVVGFKGMFQGESCFSHHQPPCGFGWLLEELSLHLSACMRRFV